MPVFALYNFDENGTVIDSAPINGAQNGIYLNGASASAGDLILDGIDDIVKLYPSPEFQMDQGTLEINFTTGEFGSEEPQTVLSRDSAGENQGSFALQVFPDGSVTVTHETEGGTETFTTGPGFFTPGDTINLTHSWDQGGTGGTLTIENTTSGDSFETAVPPTLTMDMSDQNQPWIVGGGQSTSDPDALNNIDQHFSGTVEFLSFSDSVDNTPQLPDANPDTATTTEDTDVVIDVLGNDTDPNGDPLTVTSATATNGTVTIGPDGDLTYSPNDNYNGPDTITYTITDPAGNTATSTVAVTVTPVNDAPVAEDDSDTTPINTPVLIDVLGNDSDVDGDALSIVGTPTSADGTVVVQPDGQIEFTPNTGFTGVATISYEITDGNGGTDTATVTVTVGDANAPVANPDTAETPEDTDVVIDVLGNDTDPNGDPLTVTSATATNGTVTIGPDGDLTYSPNDNYNGPDTITYTVTDPAGNTSTSTVAVTVTPVNDAPVAEDDSETTAIDTPVLIDVLGNDSDVDGDTLSIVGTPTSADGTVVVQADGRIEFTPNAGFTGVATISYEITDGNGGTDTAVVRVTVGDADTPVANPDSATTPEDEPVVIDVLGNDTDPNGDPLTVTSASAPNGTVTIGTDGRLTYTPNENFNGADTITYTITDPAGNTATSTVDVTVTPVNDAPVANPDSEIAAFNTPVVIDVLGNDTDPDGDTLTVTGTPTSADGTVVITADGQLEFTPNDGFSGDAIINYEISDGNGGTASSTVTVTVLPRPADGIVRGTDAGELIDVAYIDPFDTDRVDANDAIIPGDAPNDDRILAGGGNDTVIAGPGDDTVVAGEGDDSVTGGAGNDDLRGNEGADTLIGGDGSDTVFGQQDNDMIDTSGALPLPDIDYPGLYTADLDPDNDRDEVYGGLGDDTIRTGDDADTIFGDDGRDVIDAGLDADSVFGGQGGDFIQGGEGSDTIDGGEGSDLIFGGFDDTLGDILAIPDATDLRPDNNRDSLTGGTGDDTIYGRDDDDTLNGGIGRDVLYGGVDEDSLFGDAGNDQLFGGQGADTMLGGADRDTFTIATEVDGAGDVIDGNEEGDDFDTLDLRGSGPLRVFYDAANPENGRIDFYDPATGFAGGTGTITSTLSFVNIENVIPCFTPGTLIATPKGEVPAEELREGDKVITRDNGIQEIRWAGAKALNWNDFRLNPHLKPVLIKRGSLGNDLPEQDMLVSPNHRMLVANDRTALYFDEHEVLVSAKHLVGGQGVQVVDAMACTYLHFMCDRHEVVLANGAWTETFQPGDYTLKGMGNAQRSEIFELFPELQTAEGLDGYTAARRTLKRHEAKLLVR